MENQEDETNKGNSDEWGFRPCHYIDLQNRVGDQKNNRDRKSSQQISLCTDERNITKNGSIDPKAERC